MDVGQLSWFLAAGLMVTTGAVTIGSIRRSRADRRTYQWPPPDPGTRKQARFEDLGNETPPHGPR